MRRSCMTRPAWPDRLGTAPPRQKAPVVPALVQLRALPFFRAPSRGSSLPRELAPRRTQIVEADCQLREHSPPCADSRGAELEDAWKALPGFVVWSYGRPGSCGGGKPTQARKAVKALLLARSIDLTLAPPPVRKPKASRRPRCRSFTGGGLDPHRPACRRCCGMPNDEPWHICIGFATTAMLVAKLVWLFLLPPWSCPRCQSSCRSCALAPIMQARMLGCDLATASVASSSRSYP